MEVMEIIERIIQTGIELVWCLFIVYICNFLVEFVGFIYIFYVYIVLFILI